MSDLKHPKNQKILNDFLIEHAPLIHKHINVLKSKGLVPPNIDEADLHFAGFHGLMDALHKYDTDIASRTGGTPENAFSKYAEQRIKGKMLDHIASRDEIPKVLRTRAKNLASLKGKEDSEPAISAAPSEKIK